MACRCSKQAHGQQHTGALPRKGRRFDRATAGEWRFRPGATGRILFVYITHSEGLGSGALLAMSAGVPVIASNVGRAAGDHRASRERTAGGERRGAIAAAFGELQRDRELARRIGAGRAQTVMERFTVDHMVRRTMEVYRQVLHVIEALLALLFGLLIGSFLNVCIHRWPRDRRWCARGRTASAAGK